MVVISLCSIRFGPLSLGGRGVVCDSSIWVPLGSSVREKEPKISPVEPTEVVTELDTGFGSIFRRNHIRYSKCETKDRS